MRHWASRAARWAPARRGRRDPAALIEAFLLGGTAAFLLLKARRGELIYAIHPRYIPLVVAAALLLLGLTVARLRATGGPPAAISRGRAVGYALLALPLALALLVPARPLGADAFATTGRGTNKAASGRVAAGDDPRRWDLLQWATAVNLRGESVQGAEADLIGFVYHDPDRPLAGFFVARMVIVCCVADGSGVSLPVSWPAGAALPDNTWVRVRGTLGMAEVRGRPEPAFLATAVTVVPRPANPYLYP